MDPDCVKSDAKVEAPFIRKEFIRQLLNEIMCFQKSHFQMGRLIGGLLIERQAVHHKFSANKTAMQQSDLVLTPQLYNATSLTVTQ